MRPVFLSILCLAVLALSACERSSKPMQPIVEPAAAAATPSSESASIAPDANALQCDAQIGQAAAKRLAERFLLVSPASHPPCNVANSCEMIQGEIDRACSLYGKGEAKPKECTA